MLPISKPPLFKAEFWKELENIQSWNYTEKELGKA